MSGGVDSSVAALLLREQGYEVIGVSMSLYDASQGERFGSCCSPRDLYDARSVATALGLPFYALNMRETFAREVIADFVQEYRQGRTPNPCVRCNGQVKFGTLLRLARGLGAEHLATGHYARVGTGPDGQRQLLRARDRRKYFLFMLGRPELARALFPVGELTKDEVRALARRHGLRTADKPDSQEICFVPSGTHASFVAQQDDQVPPGEIADTAGTILGTHPGLPYFTVGQRRGLGLNGGTSYYVVRLEAATNRVVVGRREELFAAGLLAEPVSWVDPAEGETGGTYAVKIRYRHEEVPAEVRPEGPGRAVVRFGTPQRAVAPGQAVVFYDGERVAGGGWIARAL
ncbi:MAG: tRNA 2-thiouridine(34) synthase MnmA [Deltaproteobacteria bacterium]|nr:tRNA 2-thiouridine(34) synthase MnmA [Deltaproteobacteria bacterium]